MSMVTVKKITKQPVMGTQVLPKPVVKKKAGAPYRDVKRGNDTYRVYPDGTMKNLTPNKPVVKKATTTKPTTPAAPKPVPLSPEQVAANLAYAPAEKQNEESINQGRNHQTTIDQVYAGFQDVLKGTQAASATATTEAIAGMQQDSTHSLQVGTNLADAAHTAGNADNAALGRDGNQSSTVAGQVAAALASAQQGAGYQQVAQTQLGQAAQDHLGRLGVIGKMQTDQFHENTNNYVNALVKDKSAMSVEKGLAVSKQTNENRLAANQAKAAAIQQSITNTLAAQSIASKDKATQRNYEIELERLNIEKTKIEADITRSDAQISSNETIAAGNNTTTLAAARIGAKATSTEAARRRRFDAEQNRLSRVSAKELATIKTGPGGKNTSGTVSYKTSDGHVVPMSAADRKKWMTKKNTFVAAVNGADKQLSKLAGDGLSGDKLFNKAVEKIASQYGDKKLARAIVALAQKGVAGLSAEYTNLIKAYFPGGLVPKAFGGGFSLVS